MSVIVITVVQCDNCGVSIKKETGIRESVRDARAEAKSKGWWNGNFRRHDRSIVRDLCSRCQRDYQDEIREASRMAMYG